MDARVAEAISVSVDRPVIPCGIAVGRRRKFQCYVHSSFSATEAASLIFEDCGLESWGWSFGAMRVHRVGVIPGSTLFQVERG